MKDHAFTVERDTNGFTRGGRRYSGTTDADVLRVVRAWMDRAHELGGYVTRRTAREVIVTLPDDVPVEGGDELTPWVAKR